jgi:hypothetical protein
LVSRTNKEVCPTKNLNLSENLLKPGEDPGEGYKGTPDMYPDYKEDEKDQKLGRNIYQRIQSY